MNYRKDFEPKRRNKMCRPDGRHVFLKGKVQMITYLHITDLTADEMRAVDKAIFISLDTNHYYQTLQNMYNDKLQYIEKLKSNRSSLQADLATKQQYIDDFEKMLNTYDFSDIQSLKKFLEENRKEK